MNSRDFRRRPFGFVATIGAAVAAFFGFLMTFVTLALYWGFIGVCIWAIYRVVIHFTGV